MLVDRNSGLITKTNKGRKDARLKKSRKALNIIKATIQIAFFRSLEFSNERNERKMVLTEFKGLM